MCIFYTFWQQTCRVLDKELIKKHTSQTISDLVTGSGFQFHLLGYLAALYRVSVMVPLKEEDGIQQNNDVAKWE